MVADAVSGFYHLMEKYKSEDLAKHYSEQLDQLYSEYVARMKGK